jgi:large subunit ribosomal protein L35
MPKLKTRKTLKKRVKVTKTGKLLKKQVRTGHLMSKMDAARRSRKARRVIQTDIGHIRMLKKLLGKLAKRS